MKEGIPVRQESQEQKADGGRNNENKTNKERNDTFLQSYDGIIQVFTCESKKAKTNPVLISWWTG